MSSKKLIISFFCFLFISISFNGFGKTIAAAAHKEKAAVCQTVCENTDPLGEETITTVKDILHSTIRVSEIHHRNFHCLKNNQRSAIALLSGIASDKLNSWFAHYLLSITGNSSHPPFYIAYHRLII